MGYVGRNSFVSKTFFDVGGTTADIPRLLSLIGFGAYGSFIS